MAIQPEQPSPPPPPGALPETPTASVNMGLWYVFRDGPNIIRAWGSTWLGLEKVYFNNTLIEHCDHLKRREQYSFTVDGQEYRIQCVTNANVKWQVECLLWRNGHAIEGWRCKRKKLVETRPTLAHLYCGIILGLAAGLFKVPATFGVVFVGASIFLTLLTTAKTDQFTFEKTILGGLQFN